MIWATLDEEQKLWEAGFQSVCGVDEVGRGCFAGPVVAAAVVFPSDIKLSIKITDSKLLKKEKREELDKIIRELAVGFAIAQVGVEVINEIGIGRATQRAFKNCVEQLTVEADYILIDAFYIEGTPRSKQKAIIKGDQISVSIAAASIIAKVYRDQLMEKLDGEYPEYGFAKHKGYGTKEHREAIGKFGLSEMHRTSFNLSKFVNV